MSLRILRFLFGNIPLSEGADPSSDTVLDFLEKVLLGFNDSDINNEAWEAVWNFFSQCAINTIQSRRILKIRISYLDQLSASCRLELSLSRAKALCHGYKIRESLVEFDEALKLSKELFSETGLKSVLITLERCRVFMAMNEYEAIESEVVTYFNYAEITMDENDWIVPFALRILTWIDFRKGRLDHCVKNLIKALRIL